MTPGDSLADRIDAALPQTQCRRCGYEDCRAYAEAMADGAALNRCPPGGAEGIVRLAGITGRAPLPLDPECGREGPRHVVVIDESWCIGCTLCIDACPVDCIVGASKHMHSVVADDCTGCELCLSVCPVDCIASVPVSGERSGWQAWSTAQANNARRRYVARGRRLTVREPRPAAETSAAGGASADPARPTDEQRRATVAAAVERARAAARRR